MKFLFAVSAGFFASLGSVFAKLSSTFQSQDPHQAYWNSLVYLLSMITMVLCNSIGLFFFTKSLHDIDNTVIATLISMASNYILSGILGTLLFEEIVSLYWLIGSTFALLGVFLIATNVSETTIEVSQKEE